MYLLVGFSGTSSGQIGECVWIFWVSMTIGGGRGRLVAQRAGARARVHARRHVQQAVKEGRLLHHASTHMTQTQTHTCACSCHTTPRHWTQPLTAKAYMSLRKHPIHHIITSMLEFFRVQCVIVQYKNSNRWTSLYAE